MSTMEASKLFESMMEETRLFRTTRRTFESANIIDFDHFFGGTSGHPNCV